MNNMTRPYKALLRLYPRDCRAWCGPEMLDAFQRAADEHRAHGPAAFVRFGLVELSGLLMGAGAAWIAKFTSGKYMRGFWIPTNARVFSDALEAQKKADFNLRHMVDAISDRDFKRARFYSEEDLKTRNL